jgi:hypothetical protein
MNGIRHFIILNKILDAASIAVRTSGLRGSANNGKSAAAIYNRFHPDRLEYIWFNGLVNIGSAITD